MGGHEARAFMKWVVGASPNSTIKRDKKTGHAYAEKPKSHHRHRRSSESTMSSRYPHSDYSQPAYRPQSQSGRVAEYIREPGYPPQSQHPAFNAPPHPPPSHYSSHRSGTSEHRSSSRLIPPSARSAPGHRPPPSHLSRYSAHGSSAYPPPSKHPTYAGSQHQAPSQVSEYPAYSVASYHQQSRHSDRHSAYNSEHGDASTVNPADSASQFGGSRR